MSATFAFVFVEMGQGDCCLVRCPDGRIVVVDCGSTSNKYGDLNAVIEAQILLRDAKWAGGNSNKVNALVLTHSDADHYNKVITVFNAAQYLEDVKMPSTGKVIKKPKLSKIKIDNILFSNAASDDSPLGKYKGAGINKNVYSHLFETSKIWEITINSESDAGNKYKCWQKNSNFRTLAETGAIGSKRFQFLSGITDGKSWRASIIAGNVPKGYKDTKDGASEENAKSLVTLFEVEGKKALLCGDMTFSTERFLRDIHRDLLTNIELAQIPHHGSAHASASGTVGMLNPKAAVASVGFLEHSYLLPMHDPVLDRWIGTVHGKKNIAAHDIDYWTTQNDKTKKDITDADIQKTFNEWTNNKTDYSKVDSNKSQTFWFLKAPGYGTYGLYQLQKGGLFLYREGVTSNLTLTSQKTQVYTLDENGVNYKDG